MTTSKTCTVCRETKPLDGGFHRDKNRKDGRFPHCKACVITARSKHYRENRETTLSNQAEYRVRNRDRVAAQRAEYGARPENRARKVEYDRAYRKANRERIAAYDSEYRAANPHTKWESHYRQKAGKHGIEPTVISFTLDDLVARWGHDCVHCGGPFESLDHYPEPISRGGAHSLDNCRPSCNACQAHSWRPGFTATHNSNTTIKENN
jgi:hypothetical protein